MPGVRWIKKLPRHKTNSSLLFFAALALTAWAIYLYFSLPDSYNAAHWNLAWAGFDIGMVMTLSVTSWAIWKKRQVAIPGAIISAAFLVIDAWFDVLTSKPGADFYLSLLLAACGISAALILFRFSREAIRRSIHNAYSQAGRDAPSTSLWRTPLAIFDEEVK